MFNTPLLGWNYLLTGTNSLLAPRRREMEREADRFAIDMLTRARLDPSALGQYMQRSAESDRRAFKFLSSSHPSYDERAQTFAAARIRGREILSPSEWAHLRAICRITTEKAPAFLQEPG